MQFADNAFAQADQGHHCLLTELMNTVVLSVDDVQAHQILDHLCLHMAYGPFPM